MTKIWKEGNTWKVMHNRVSAAFNCKSDAEKWLKERVPQDPVKAYLKDLSRGKFPKLK